MAKAKKQTTTTIRARIEGVRPLLSNNGMMADPLFPPTRVLARAVKEGKTIKDDPEKVAEMVGFAEFAGCMYWDDDLGPVIPSENLERLLRDGAAAEKLGKDSQSDVEIFSPDGLDVIPIEYDGPRDLDGLWEDKRFVFRKCVKVGRARMPRTRPRFPPGWSLTFDLVLYPWAKFNAEAAERALRTAGQRKGLGDWRPKYGLFAVTQFGVAKAA